MSSGLLTRLQTPEGEEVVGRRTRVDSVSGRSVVEFGELTWRFHILLL